MSPLNLVSLLGLGVMILLAWLMSTYRWRVDWRLVGLGVSLQLILAAVFFNSQTWTFPRTFRTAEELLSAVQNQEIDPSAVIRKDAASSPSIALSGLAGTDPLRGRGSAAAVAAVNRLMAESPDGVSVPRFPNGIVFFWVESFFSVIQRSVDQGTAFLFRVNAPANTTPPTDPRALIYTFAFGILPTVIFFAALMSVLYYIGLMQWLIRGLAWLMRKTLGTTAVESLATAANVFVGHTEAPLVVRPYVANMTRSELNALMVGGFSTISGSLMAIFASMGISAGHLLTASLISAPAALVVAKILQPETETPVPAAKLADGVEPSASNIIEAAAIGASDGMKLAINIAAMLIAFLALIAFCDLLLQNAGSLFGLELSLGRIFGWIFWPLAWVMGIATNDCNIAGDLLGKKMVINEFIAYLDLTAVAVEESASGEGITERSRVILTYALCGFSNFGAVGIQIGGIGPLAPHRRSDLAQLGLRAMFGGMLAACMTACIAGLFFGVVN